jgi:hypothetical protein
MEHLLLKGYSNESVHYAFFDIFEPAYRAVFPETTDIIFHPKTPENAFKALALYTERWKSDPREEEVLYTEIAGSVPVSAERVIYFRMDSIIRRLRDNKIISRDHKTKQGYFATQWDNQWWGSLAVGTYTHALYCLYPMDQVKGVQINGVAWPKTKAAKQDIQRDFKRVPCWRTPEQMQQWLWNVNSVIDELEFEMNRFALCKDSDELMRAFPQNPTACADWFGCAFLDFCFAWRNPIQKIDYMPQGFKVEFWDPTAKPASHKMMLEWPGVEKAPKPVEKFEISNRIPYPWRGGERKWR